MFDETKREGPSLADLPIGAKAFVESVKAKGSIRGRILAMGLVPGTALEDVRKAPMGDPIEIVLKGYHLSLRSGEARAVKVSSTPVGTLRGIEKEGR